MDKSQKDAIIVLPDGITQEMIDAAKLKFKGVTLAQLPKDDDMTEYLTVLVRQPDRSVMSEFSKWSDKNPGKADDILVKSCLLSHKEVVIADDGLFAGCVDAIAQLISIRKAILKKI